MSLKEFDTYELVELFLNFLLENNADEEYFHYANLAGKGKYANEDELFHTILLDNTDGGDAYLDLANLANFAFSWPISSISWGTIHKRWIKLLCSIDSENSNLLKQNLF